MQARKTPRFHSNPTAGEHPALDPIFSQTNITPADTIEFSKAFRSRCEHTCRIIRTSIIRGVLCMLMVKRRLQERSRTGEGKSGGKRRCTYARTRSARYNASRSFHLRLPRCRHIYTHTRVCENIMGDAEFRLTGRLIIARRLKKARDVIPRGAAHLEADTYTTGRIFISGDKSETVFPLCYRAYNVSILRRLPSL